MSGFSFLIIVVLASFVLVGVLHRARTSEEFHSANRNVSTLTSIATLFTVVGAPHFAIFTTLAFLYGWWSVAFYLGALSGFLILLLFSEKIRSFIPEDVHSFADIAALTTGRNAGFILSLLGFLFTAGVVVAQVILGAQLIEAITTLSYTWGVLLLVGAVVVYLFLGGYKALVKTDLVQGMAMFFFTIAFVIFLLGTHSQVTFTAPVVLPLVPFVPLFYLGGVLAVIGAPEIWQRILTARSEQVARKGLLGAGITMAVWGALVVFIGIVISAAMPELAPGTAFVEYVSTQLPVWGVGLVVVLLLSAMISTADTELFTGAVLLQKEWRRIRNLPSVLNMQITKVTVLVLAIIITIGALFFESLVDVFGVLLNIGYIAAPLALAATLHKSQSRSFSNFFQFSALLAIIAFGYVWFGVGDFFSWWSLLIIIFASLPLFYAVKSRTRKSV